MTDSRKGEGLTVGQLATVLNVSERSIYLARELQRCSRPDLEARVLSGELTLRAALRIAKPGKFGKRDKIDQWMAQFRSWSGRDRLLAYIALQIECGVDDYDALARGEVAVNGGDRSSVGGHNAALPTAAD